MLIPNNPKKITTSIGLKNKLVSFSQTFCFQFIKKELLVNKYNCKKTIKVDLLKFV
jgi:hypothetical protein